MLHCCCVRWNARRASLEPWCNQTRREERRRRRAARCARAAERRAAVKASVRRFFRRVFCRAGLEDEEKEAERQRVLEDGHVPGAPTWRWVPISRPGQFNQVNAPPAELFSVGSGVDEEEEEEDHRHVLDRPRSIRDSESITLVGTEGSESGRDSYEEGEDDADDEKGHSLPESDDGASESGSESSVSDMSTTMEVDLARFRAVTVVVSNMVAAGEGMMRMREREREQQDAQSRNGWSRPLSPASSLPGYTSDDGLPPAYADTTHHGAAAELPDAVISNGFRYVPGGVWSPRP
ncbi:hypothetical protein SODALDRAFT_326328 [Sodiomyces alkalinus F11]|uniref:Uncharacterized protein n=1 Tax=Sodiomyces alkalinus (strain CBS 110278 / VKM F-3762 / F11) TaxID=1314773 RepID=A0A3N2Q5Z7_SODAK|nr:hypothetical protein SODALDRAFT_326328 [Sodiomyces alkalinus F11]ROT42160.1 hypothetical protein SODALDRAFT_326328 [Sodiomyces alkalinus F11]